MRQRTAGFTLIELLIVVVIIGLLAAIALPKFGYTKEKAYVSTMKGDLRNLATAQEAYWNDNATYYNGSIPTASLVYNPSLSVAISVQAATNAGWSAKATHTHTNVACALFIGSASAVAPATTEGQIACQ
ncbi:MAG: prepilin-type N-terminal cleavage/methylation domain-containing protein [Gemmatimonadales bacterium]|nr:prepilin-type N-terminal cleavage/methylation domain-containing protein [Gemmatimonadales bacterium]